MHHFPLLTLLIWLPFVGAGLVLMTGGDQNANLARWIALIFSLVTLGLCFPLYFMFNTHTAAMQFTENLPWIDAYGIRYHLGVDGISMPFIFLTVYTTIVIVLASWKTVNTKVSQYLAAFLVMQGMIVGLFCALDAVLFYVFWEGTLIPIYLSIGIWGSNNRSYASIKFFLFTFAGSAIMLVALLYLHAKTGNFSILQFFSVKLTFAEQIWIFVAFLLAFSVKVPMWPVHTWLPDAHTEAPAGGSVVLAALMLKMGAYGFLRFSLPIVPDACQYLTWFMIVLSLIAVVYIGLVAIMQTDMKRLIAYSSVAHMGFVTLGIFMLFLIFHKTGHYVDGHLTLEGGMVQMISHAFSTGAIFIAIGFLYERMHTREIKDFGGIANTMPIFAAFMMLACMANVGLPGTSGFVGEFMVLLGSFQGNFWVALFAATTLILSACYTLWMYKRVFYGDVANSKVAALKDVSGIEITVLVFLAVPILVIGVWPEVLLRVFHPSVNHLIHLALVNKI